MSAVASLKIGSRLEAVLRSAAVVGCRLLCGCRAPVSVRDEAGARLRAYGVAARRRSAVCAAQSADDVERAAQRPVRSRSEARFVHRAEASAGRERDRSRRTSAMAARRRAAAAPSPACHMAVAPPASARRRRGRRPARHREAMAAGVRRRRANRRHARFERSLALHGRALATRRVARMPHAARPPPLRMGYSSSPITCSA